MCPPKLGSVCLAHAIISSYQYSILKGHFIILILISLKKTAFCSHQNL